MGINGINENKNSIPGKIAKIFVKNMQSVKKGDVLVIVEAMKMEHRILASTAGQVTAVHFTTGEQVQQGSVLLEMAEHED